MATHAWRRHGALLFKCWSVLVGLIVGGQFCPSTAWPDELAALVEMALANHPRVAEARARAEQVRDRYQELYGFFDPSLRLAGGASEAVRGLPGLNDFGSLSSEAFEIQSSLEVPFRPGFYFSVGLVERDHRKLVADGHLYETLFGVGLRIPLLQDRGFKIWQLDRQRRLAELDLALSDYLAVRQGLRRDVELVYVALCESLALFDISREATGRFETLLKETETLVEHKDIAAYQIFAASMELDLSRAEELAARQQVDVLLIQLAEVLGTGVDPDVRINRDDWLEGSRALGLAPLDNLAHFLINRGDYLRLFNDRWQAELGRQAEQERLRGDLSLRAAATWQDYDASAPFGSGSAGDDERLGGQVMLVYQRPLGFRAERSRVSAYTHQIAEIEARLRRLELEVQRDWQISVTRFDSARRRLAEISRAVAAARQNLEAEAERFRLGESRSRNVLDAQKDVTNAARRQIAAAADLRRAWSEHAYATGYPGDAAVRDVYTDELGTERGQ